MYTMKGEKGSYHVLNMYCTICNGLIPIPLGREDHMGLGPCERLQAHLVEEVSGRD